jgi:hypothetical protein
MSLGPARFIGAIKEYFRRETGSGGLGNGHYAPESTVAATIIAHHVQHVFQAFANKSVGLTGEFGFRHFDETFDQAGMDAARLGDAEISATANIGHNRLSLEGLSKWRFAVHEAILT